MKEHFHHPYEACYDECPEPTKEELNEARDLARKFYWNQIEKKEVDAKERYFWL